MYYLPSTTFSEVDKSTWVHAMLSNAQKFKQCETENTNEYCMVVYSDTEQDISRLLVNGFMEFMDCWFNKREKIVFRILRKY